MNFKERLGKTEIIKSLSIFLTLAMLGLTPATPVEAERELPPNCCEQSTMVEKSGREEPERIYAIEHNFPGVSGLYRVAGGTITLVTEKELNQQLGSVVIRCDTNFFASKDGQKPISYVMLKPTILDPEIGGGKEIHWGVDINSASPEKGTIITNVFRAKFREWVGFRRIGPHALVTQLVDKDDQEISLKIAGQDYFVFAIYGHIRVQAFTEKKDGEILEVGTPLGDVTRDRLPESGPHTHLELLLISQKKYQETLKTGKGLHPLLTNEEYSNVVDNGYLDSTIFWKFMPGNVTKNTGRSQLYLDVTKSLKARNTVHRQ